METLSFGQVRSFRVLLVDDDRFSLRVARHIIDGFGVAHLEEALNGESAVDVREKISSAPNESISPGTKVDFDSVGTDLKVMYQKSNPEKKASNRQHLADPQVL